MDIYDVEKLRATGPLNEATRDVRKSLLVASIVGWAFARIGLVPTKISALGIELSAANQSALFVLAAIVVGYFLTTFIVDASTDAVLWWLNLNTKTWQLDREEANEARDTLLKEHQVPEEIRDIYADIGRHQGAMWRNSRYSQNIDNAPKITVWILRLRLLFDVGLPTISGGYVLYLLIRKTISGL